MGVLSTLGFILVLAKVFGLIDLSWLWVLAPFWVPWAFIMSFFFVPMLLMGALSIFIWVAEGISAYKQHRNRKTRL
jgi:hypothetical protein